MARWRYRPTRELEPKAVEVARHAFDDCFEAYAVVQTVAERPVVDAARVHVHRLMELWYEVLGDSRRVWTDRFDLVAELIDLARQETIDAMRAELRLAGSARRPKDFNPFHGTKLADEYDAAQRNR